MNHCRGNDELSMVNFKLRRRYRKVIPHGHGAIGDNRLTLLRYLTYSCGKDGSCEKGRLRCPGIDEHMLLTQIDAQRRRPYGKTKTYRSAYP